MDDDSELDRKRSARSAVRLPGFINDDDIGLGDVVKRVSSAAGIRPCRRCDKRAEAMNSWLVFRGRGGQDA